MTAAAYVDVPGDWQRVRARRVGPFVTAEIFRRPDGTEVEWDSRSHRKRGRGRLQGTMLWAPHAIAWWIAVLFMIGSLCFILGPLPFYANLVGDHADAVTFFVGSIFFTSAAFLQLVEVGAAPRSLTRHREHRARLLVAVEARRLDWWACSVQFLGTLFFNVTTFHALNVPATIAQSNEAIWRPDWRGSICFLIASWFAYIEVGHRVWSYIPRSRSWQIAALNMIGSIAFGISAISSYTLATGSAINLWVANAGTVVGAVCFFAGAALLLPERVQSGP